MEKEREGNINVLRDTWINSLLHAPTGDPARNPGMCPDWEWNQQPLGSEAGTQSTKPHQPGQDFYFEASKSLFLSARRVSLPHGHALAPLYLP